MSDVATVALATLTGLATMAVAAGVIELVYRLGGDRIRYRGQAAMFVVLGLAILFLAFVLGVAVLDLLGYDTGFFNGGGVAV